MIPLSLYIHFPWCIRKCPYCDFNSHPLKQALPEEKYIAHLVKDMKHEVSRVKGRKIDSVFMGGGTPSLFSPQAIQYLLNCLRQLIDFAPDVEITLEANPGTVEQEKFAGFLDAGVNRLSLGIQSFNAEHLKKLGRIHDAETACQAVDSVKKAGFTNFNLDLMQGLPQQTQAEALADIQTALAFNPPHLSWYQLTLEPHTPFYQRPPILPDEDTLTRINEAGHDLLITHHYQQYEISAYSQKGVHCRHNINYWEFGDYIGIGAGAHGKITDITSGAVTRTQKEKHPHAYLKSENFAQHQHTVTPSWLVFEFMLNGLRLQKPISWSLFSSRTFLDKNTILLVMHALVQKNLMQSNENSFEPTLLGRRFLNDVLTAFMPA